MKKLPKPMTKSQFNALSPARRRVVVAKDVIKQILAERLVARSSTFITTQERSFATPGVGVDKIKHGGLCHVCGIGALAVSSFMKFNGHPSTDLESSRNSELRNDLRCLFSREQLCLIECAFERNQLFTSYHFGVGEDDKLELLRDQFPIAIQFSRLLDDDEDRLICIMQNMIDHKGDFRPEVEYVIA